MSKIAVFYLGGVFRVHAADCKDCGRERGRRTDFPAGATFLDMGKHFFGDLAEEDPDSWTDDDVESQFCADSRVLPCAEGLIGDDDLPEGTSVSSRPGRPVEVILAQASRDTAQRVLRAVFGDDVDRLSLINETKVKSGWLYRYEIVH